MSSEETITQIEVVEQPKPNQINIEKKYSLAIENILTSNKNRGEKDEVLFLLDVYHFNEMNEFDKLTEIFGEEASEGISILNLDTDDEINDINKLSKAPSGYKADCKIRMKKTNNTYSVSIKSKNGANPAILNHTPRTAKVFREDGILCDCIPSLDEITREYIDKRRNKIIGEDIQINKLESLNNPSIKNKFIDALTYFIFCGSGRGDSVCKANAVIHYEGKKATFIKCINIEEKHEYVKTIYDKIIISLRDKGMPKSIHERCKPWVFNDINPDGSIKQKGSLHIRIK